MNQSLRNGPRSTPPRGQSSGVLFHTDRRSTYGASACTCLSERLPITRADAESCLPTLEHEELSRIISPPVSERKAL